MAITKVAINNINAHNAHIRAKISAANEVFVGMVLLDSFIDRYL
jgi:hypothetical protein